MEDSTSPPPFQIFGETLRGNIPLSFSLELPLAYDLRVTLPQYIPGLTLPQIISERVSSNSLRVIPLCREGGLPSNPLNVYRQEETIPLQVLWSSQELLGY